jgi:hypothetical protein
MVLFIVAMLAPLAALHSVLLKKTPAARGAVGDRVLFAQRTIACSDIHAYTGRSKQHDHFCRDWVDGGERGRILQTNDRHNAYCINVRGLDSLDECRWFTDGFSVTKE